MALNQWQIDDGTKRTLWQRPTSLLFWTYPIVPSWKIIKGGQLNQTLYTSSSVTILPQFVYQGLRRYDSPVAWRPDYIYREVPYEYVMPVSYVFPTVNETAFNFQPNIQVVNNYAFKLQRMQFYFQTGFTNTASIINNIGAIIYDWQSRQLMSSFVNTAFLDFNASNSTSFVYGPHSSFPSVPLLYPVNGQIRIDLTDMNCPAAGGVSDLQGQILLQGVNLVPCGAGAPGAKLPGVLGKQDPLTDLSGGASGGASRLLPYFYTANMLNMAQNKATFSSSNKFTLSLDGDSEFLITAIHNAQTADIDPPL